MSAVTVVANLACLGLRRGQEVTVELTDLIQGAVDAGKLSLVCGGAVADVEVEVDEDNLDDITEADETAAMKPPQGKQRR